MNRHSLRWGAAASGALTGFYVAVLAASDGWSTEGTLPVTAAGRAGGDAS